VPGGGHDAPSRRLSWGARYWRGLPSRPRFIADDHDEARSRLERLAQVWRIRLRALDDTRLDRHEGDAWTIREVAFHVAESAYYADAVGDLS
jgi:hypothetical protein